MKPETTLTVPDPFEARLLTSQNIETLLYHNKRDEETVITPRPHAVDVSGTTCIHISYKDGRRVSCSNAATQLRGMLHGFLCPDHYWEVTLREQGKPPEGE